MFSLKKQADNYFAVSIDKGKIKGYLVYNEGLNEETEKGAKFKAKMGNFFAMSDNIMLASPQREVLRICGPSGSGKSTFIRHYAAVYKKIHNNPILLFTVKDKDPSLMKEYTDSNYIKGKVDYDIYDLSTEESLDNLTYENIRQAYPKNTLFIFDDVIFDKSKLGKKQSQSVQQLLDKVLQLGRQYNHSVIFCEHTLNNGIQSQLIDNEATATIIFPNRIPYNNIVYYAKKKGVDIQLIDELKKTQAKFIAIRQQFPLLLITDTAIIDYS
jgi:tRNA A37 threonylcarbamoyladenosine biosynthesis protein TsaE